MLSPLETGDARYMSTGPGAVFYSNHFRGKDTKSGGGRVREAVYAPFLPGPDV